MKKALLTTVVLCVAVTASAQVEQDPVLLVIAGESVPRSEFEYSYNKNNAEGVIDKKTVEEYVDLFINYKLKVKAAEEAQMDTLPSFLAEYIVYRDRQIRPAMVTDEDVEHEAYKIYEKTRQEVDSTGGIFKPAHIFLPLRQDADEEAYLLAKQQADSIYNTLKENNFDENTFAELVRHFSRDQHTFDSGGVIGWLRRGQLLPEFDDKISSMEVGETSQPVRFSDGIHIIQLRGKQPCPPYDTVRESLIASINGRGMREALINQKLDSLAAVQGEGVTRDDVLAQKREEMEAADMDLKYLIKEYHDGLLLYEISNNMVWSKAENDVEGLEQYYNKNKKQYRWDEPRFKGIAYRTKDTTDVEKVKDVLHDIPFDEWVEVLRTTFNADSVQIRAEKGLFRQGDNAIVDMYVFGVDSVSIDDKFLKDYPNTSTYGRLITQPEEYSDVRGLVVGDYQEELEKTWVAALRKKYPVVIDRAVLATVNKHE